MTEEVQGEIVKEPQEIIPAVDPEVRLGSLAIRDPRELVLRATELANALAEVIHAQHLYVVIQKNKYTKVEGWLTLGAMLGVVPIEDYCRKLPDGKGFEAKINLIRAKDSGLVGAASAECTYDEKNWASRESYSLRSMSLTRATGKAFRLSFGWIMKLAGFEATPAEEMYEVDGSAEASQAVAQRKIAEYKAKKEAEFVGAAPLGRPVESGVTGGSMPPTVPHAGEVPPAPKPKLAGKAIVSWPSDLDGNAQMILAGQEGMDVVAQRMKAEALARWLDKRRAYVVPATHLDFVKLICVQVGYDYEESRGAESGLREVASLATNPDSPVEDAESDWPKKLTAPIQSSPASVGTSPTAGESAGAQAPQPTPRGTLTQAEAPAESTIQGTIEQATEKMTANNQPMMQVLLKRVVKGKVWLPAFDNALFPILAKAVGYDCELIIQNAKRGPVIVGFKRIGNRFFDSDGKIPVIQQSEDRGGDLFK